MEQFRQSKRNRSNAAGADILRIRRDEEAVFEAFTREGELNRKGQAVLDLVSQVADSITTTETRIETLLTRALGQLRTLEERNQELEERAMAAETKAREAEKWLVRLHNEMEAKLTARATSQTLAQTSEVA